MIHSIFSNISKILPKHGGAVAGIGLSMLLGQCTGLHPWALGMQHSKLDKSSSIAAPPAKTLKTLATEEVKSIMLNLVAAVQAADESGDELGNYGDLRTELDQMIVLEQKLHSYVAQKALEKSRLSLIDFTISYKMLHCLDYILDEEVKALREFVPFFIENEARKHNLQLYYGLCPLIQAYVGLPTYIKQYLMKRLKEMRWSQKECNNYERF